MRCDVCIMAATMAAIWIINSTANAQQSSATPQAITGNPASNPDQELGRRFLIKPEKLAAAENRSSRGKPISAHTICRTNTTGDGGLHGHAICHGPGASSPIARSSQ